MEILLALAALILSMIYMIFHSVNSRKSPFLMLLWIILFVGITVLCAYFYAAIKSSYYGQKEWQQERYFFLRIFVQKLESSGDLKTAAKYMQSEDVKKQTLACIQKIVQTFHPKARWGLSIGSATLILSVMSLWLKQITSKKYYPCLLLFFILLGNACLNTGVYYRLYASRTDHYLKNFLRLQQEYLMKDLSEIKTELSVAQIITITIREAERIEGFGYGQVLPGLLRSEKSSAQQK